jgi:hypothetical protein
MNALNCQKMALPEACLQAEGELKHAEKELRVGKAQLSYMGLRLRIDDG